MAWLTGVTLLLISASASTCSSTQVFWKSHLVLFNRIHFKHRVRAAFQTSQEMCIHYILFFKLSRVFSFPVTNNTSTKRPSFHGPDLSPGSQQWLLEAAGTPHLEGWALLCRHPLGTRLERRCGCWQCSPRIPLLDGSWPECHPLRNSAFSTSLQQWGGRSARDTPPLGRLSVR